LQDQRIVGVAEDRHVGHAQRAERLTVVAVLQADEAVARALPRVAVGMEAHLERDLHRRGTVRAEEAVSEHAARQPDQPLGQLHRRAVRGAGQHGVLQHVQLRLDRGVDMRIGMAEQVDPPRAGAVQVALAVEVDQPGALAARDRQRRHGVEPRILRARVPDRRAATRLPCRIGTGRAVRRHGDGGIRHTSLLVARPAAAKRGAAWAGTWRRMVGGMPSGDKRTNRRILASDSMP